MQITISKDETDRINWLATITICFQYICGISGINGISIVLAFFLIILSSIKLINKTMKFYANVFLIIACIVMAFIVSLVRVYGSSSTTENYMVRFFLYDIVALIIGSQKFDRVKVVNGAIVIGTIGIPFFLLKNNLNMSTNDLMGLSYSCLPVLLVSIIGLFGGKKYVVLSVINIVVIIYRYVTIAPRGIWVIVATFTGLLIYHRMCFGKKSRIIIPIVVLSGIVLLVYLINNLEIVISYFNNLLFSKFNIKVYAIDKYMRYLTQDKLFNGRDAIWMQAIELIKKQPVFGYGIGYYEALFGIAHLHNCFLQALCEAGFFFFLPLGYITIIEIWNLIRGIVEYDIQGYLWLVFGFCCGLEILFFSSAYWLHMPFWFFLGSNIVSFSEMENENLQVNTSVIKN